jgi:hypothetical protein
MKRRNRLLTALFTIAALLFSQLAVASYSCPKLGEAEAVVAMDASSDAAPADEANLCAGHCMYGNASAEPAKTPASPPLAMDAGLRVVGFQALAIRAPSGTPFRAQPTAAPPLARFTVLRI